MTRRARKRRTQSQRCFFSGAIVVLLLAAASLPNVLSGHFRSFRQEIDAVQAIVSGEEEIGEGVFDELEKARLRDVPSAFVEEVLDVSNYPSVFVNDDGSIVGFSKNESALQSFSGITRELQSRGWAFVESGSRYAASFVKSSGRYRWAFVSCTPVSGQTSVVIQTIPLGE